MLSYRIKEPIWETESVGIADHRVKGDDTMEVRIAYKDKQDNLVYPNRYTMTTEKIRTYPTKVVKGGVKLHIVPIVDFDIAG